jgi:hypothetical protein
VTSLLPNPRRSCEHTFASMTSHHNIPSDLLPSPAYKLAGAQLPVAAMAGCRQAPCRPISSRRPNTEVLHLRHLEAPHAVGSHSPSESSPESPLPRHPPPAFAVTARRRRFCANLGHNSTPRALVVTPDRSPGQESRRGRQNSGRPRHRAHPGTTLLGLRSLQGLLRK